MEPGRRWIDMEQNNRVEKRTEGSFYSKIEYQGDIISFASRSSPWETEGKEIGMTSTNVLWASRFRSGPAPELMALSRSDASHFRLAAYDLAASFSHARELVRAKLLTQEEGEAIEATLGDLRAEIGAG